MRFALSEGGIGWIPYFLERVDYVDEHHRAWTGHDLPGGMLPSELFRERFITCFIDDAAGISARHDVGIDHITWECDYPHSDSTWPDSPERLARSLAPVPAEEVHAITHRNAMRLFSYDPFSVDPRRGVHGGGPAGPAGDVDTRPRPSGKPVVRPDTPIRIIDLAERAAPTAAASGDA